MNAVTKKAKGEHRTHLILFIIGVPTVGFAITFWMNNQEYEFFTTEHLYGTIGSILVTALSWSGCWGITYFLWKKFPWHLKPLTHLFLEIAAILIYILLVMSLMYFIYTFFKEYEETYTHYWQQVGSIIILALFLTTLHECIHFYRQWRENFRKSEKFEKASIKAQYDTLKSQVNPHFLFNSLNTLTTMVEKNPKALDYVQNLSDFLRSVLDNSGSEIRLLRDEVKIIEKYCFYGVCCSGFAVVL